MDSWSRLQSINPSTSVVLSVSDGSTAAASWRHGPSNLTLLPIYVHASRKREIRLKVPFIISENDSLPPIMNRDAFPRARSIIQAGTHRSNGLTENPTRSSLRLRLYFCPMERQPRPVGAQNAFLPNPWCENAKC